MNLVPLLLFGLLYLYFLYSPSYKDFLFLRIICVEKFYGGSVSCSDCSICSFAVAWDWITLTKKWNTWCDVSMFLVSKVSHSLTYLHVQFTEFSLKIYILMVASYNVNCLRTRLSYCVKNTDCSKNTWNW